jgi:hypothetical protein
VFPCRLFRPQRNDRIGAHCAVGRQVTGGRDTAVSSANTTACVVGSTAPTAEEDTREQADDDSAEREVQQKTGSGPAKPFAQHGSDQLTGRRADPVCLE